MPVETCQVDGRSGLRWGRRGKCFVGQGARERALRQGRAIKAGQTYNQRRRSVIVGNPLKMDPSRTTTLRREFVTELTKRWQRLKGKVNALVIVEDAFALRLPQSPFAINEGGNIVANQRWRFQTDTQKVASFQQWLMVQIQLDVITVTQQELENAYWQKYVEEGYRKGAGRAFADTRKAALATGAEELAFFEGTKQEFLHQSFGSPVVVEKVKLLTSRVFSDLKGVGEATATKITRELADGLVQGQNPHKIARTINKNISTIGQHRSVLIARTEIIRAHSEGQLDAFERLDVEEVGVAAEWSTAGDDRVCPLCQPLEGIIMTVKEARGIIPRHVQCRCAWLPANVGELTKGQQRSKTDIQEAISESISAERPKRIKRTLAEQKRKTSWSGVDKTIVKKRPKSILGAEPSQVAVEKVQPRASTIRYERTTAAKRKAAAKRRAATAKRKAPVRPGVKAPVKPRGTPAYKRVSQEAIKEMDHEQLVDYILDYGKNTSTQFSKEVREAVASLPESHLRLLASKGESIHTGGVVTDAIPELRGTRPRGWPPGSTWDNTHALYCKNRKEVVLSEFRVSKLGATRTKRVRVYEEDVNVLASHEVGHVLDSVLGGFTDLSQREEFVSVWRGEVATLLESTGSHVRKGADYLKGDASRLAYYLQPDMKSGRASAAGASETFAEAYGIGQGREMFNHQLIEKHFPKTITKVKKMVDKEVSLLLGEL